MPALLTSEQKQAARRKLKLPATGSIIGNAGWLISRKRFDVFLRTAAVIAARCPDAHFVIAGDGDERPRLEALAAELNLTGRLTWTGWLENTESFFVSLDVLLFNSDWDALPVTPQQAMAYGVPVVGSVEHGGLKEIISQSEFGFLLDRHDTEALAAAVVRLIQTPAEAEQIGLAGRIRIRAMSDPEAIAMQHEKLLAG